MVPLAARPNAIQKEKLGDELMPKFWRSRQFSIFIRIQIATRFSLQLLLKNSSCFRQKVNKEMEALRSVLLRVLYVLV